MRSIPRKHMGCQGFANNLPAGVSVRIVCKRGERRRLGATRTRATPLPPRIGEGPVSPIMLTRARRPVRSTQVSERVRSGLRLADRTRVLGLYGRRDVGRYNPSSPAGWPGYEEFRD